MGNIDREYIDELSRKIEKNRSESFKKARMYLRSLNFFEKKLEDKTDFLTSVDGLVLLEGLSGDKLSILEISNCLDVTQNTFHDLMKEFPSIYDAVDRGRSKENSEVVEALRLLATGYYKEEETIENYKNERGSIASKTKVQKRWFPPNAYAADKWLINKQKMEWKEKQLELETAKNTIHIKFEIIGDDTVNHD